MTGRKGMNNHKGQAKMVNQKELKARRRKQEGLRRPETYFRSQRVCMSEEQTPGPLEKRKNS